MICQFKILRRMSRINSITILDVKKHVVASSGTCLAGSHGKLPGRAETEKIWPMLKDSLVIAQEQFMPPYIESGIHGRRPAQINKDDS